MTLKPLTRNASEPEWFKGSYSGSSNNDCVEVADTPGTVLVRDSKSTRGPRLRFTPAVWADFVTYASEL